MDSKRYFVDERGGIIAVRNRDQTDPEYKGLHGDTPGVIWYEMGWSDEKNNWNLLSGARTRAEIVCDTLNLVTRLEVLTSGIERPTVTI